MPSALLPNFLRHTWIRCLWRWHQLRGWKVEGPLPKPGEKTCLLLSKAMASKAIMTSFLELKLNQQASANSSFNRMQDCHSLPATSPPSIAQAVQCAIDMNANIQLVLLDSVARRIRVHTPLKPGPHSRRTIHYIVRILSHSAENQMVGEGDLLR